MKRRDFLLNSASFLMGSFLGLHSFSKAYAGLSQCSMALIIDDIGFSKSRARRFLDLDIPLTFSILPRLHQSEEIALEIHNMGHEIMLHQPMEPYNPDINPGPGALYVGYDAERIMEIMEENFSTLSNIKGVNNHMGSKFTERQREVSECLTLVKEKGLYFIDSLTTSRSKAYNIAKNLHIETARRNFFLDIRLEESAILGQLHRCQQYSLRHGCAIGIGHPFPETARAIDYFMKHLKNASISFVNASELICFT